MSSILKIEQVMILFVTQPEAKISTKQDFLTPQFFWSCSVYKWLNVAISNFLTFPKYKKQKSWKKGVNIFQPYHLLEEGIKNSVIEKLVADPMV